MTLVAIMGFNLCATTLFILSLLIAFLSRTGTEGAATYLYHFCPNDTSFTANSTYQSNLNHLLASLTSNATRPTGFYNTTASSPNSVETAYSAAATSPATIAETAFPAQLKTWLIATPRKKTPWLGTSTACYATKTSISSPAWSPTLAFTCRATLIYRIQAGLTSWQAGFQTLGLEPRSLERKKRISKRLQTLHTLAQCTPDLLGSDCSSCLQKAIASLSGCCGGKQGGRVLFPSCNVRFEVYPFYSVNTSAPALVPPPPGLVTKPKGQDQISAVIIIAIVVPISLSIELLITGYCFLISRRARKKYNAIQQENAANDITTVESLQFDLATIKIATNKFLDDNKLGEGGFGVVYKGLLANGQEIAMKRLSKTFGQGKEEFKTKFYW